MVSTDNSQNIRRHSDQVRRRSTEQTADQNFVEAPNISDMGGDVSVPVPIGTADTWIPRRSERIQKLFDPCKGGEVLRPNYKC